MMLVGIMVLHHVSGHRHGHGGEGRGSRRHFNSLCSLWSSIRVQPGYKGVVLRGRGRRKGHYDLCWPPKKEPGVEPGGGGIARGSQQSLKNDFAHLKLFFQQVFGMVVFMVLQHFEFRF